MRSRYLQYYDPETGEWNTADAIPDIGRIERQQSFIRRIGSLAYRSALDNPLKANEIADDVIPKLVVDSALDRADVFKLVNTFRTVDPADPNSVEMLTLPTSGSKSSDGQDILLPDAPDSDTVLARIRTFAPPVAPPTGILPAQVRVRVLNGSGTDGLASTTLDSLQRQFGFAGAGLGNAPRVAKTEIRYRPGVEKAARLVAGYLGGAGKLVEDAGIADADVVLVLGPDFHGDLDPAGGAARAHVVDHLHHPRAVVADAASGCRPLARAAAQRPALRPGRRPAPRRGGLHRLAPTGAGCVPGRRAGPHRGSAQGDRGACR